MIRQLHLTQESSQTDLELKANEDSLGVGVESFLCLLRVRVRYVSKRPRPICRLPVPSTPQSHLDSILGVDSEYIVEVC